MNEPTRQTILTSRPRGWKRVLLRAPIILFELHLGWILGPRFLLLRHVGRRSGAVRKTVLEIVRHDPETEIYTVASAFGGRNSQWFQNLQRTPDVEITVGTKRRRALAVPLGEGEGEQVFRDYASRHPRAWAQLFRLIIGSRFDGSDDAFHTFAENVPAVDLSLRAMAD